MVLKRYMFSINICSVMVLSKMIVILGRGLLSHTEYVMSAKLQVLSVVSVAFVFEVFRDKTIIEKKSVFHFLCYPVLSK